MNFLKTLAIPGILLINSTISFATDNVETITLGNIYYRAAYDCDSRTHSYREVLEHPISLPDDFRGDRTEYTKRGLPFIPREFFEKPMTDKLRYLKDPIIECGLLKLIDQHKDDPYDGILYASSSSGLDGNGPYPEEVEEQFEEAVWNKLKDDYDISLEDFKASIRSKLVLQDRLWSAPLIVHFQAKLFPRYEFHFNKSGVLKVFKLSSEFEEFVGIGQPPKLVYEKGMPLEKFEELNRVE